MHHYETVSPGIIMFFKKLGTLPELTGFNLVGRTSLALQTGHRVSVDSGLFQVSKKLSQKEKEKQERLCKAGEMRKNKKKNL